MKKQHLFKYTCKQIKEKRGGGGGTMFPQPISITKYTSLNRAKKGGTG